MTLPRLTRERNFRNAVNNLAQYYGYRANLEEINAIARILGNINNGQVLNTTGRERDAAANNVQSASNAETQISTILSLFFDSTIGAHSSEQLIENLNRIITRSPDNDRNAIKTAIGNIIQIISDHSTDAELRDFWPTNIAQFKYLRRVSIRTSEGRVPILGPTTTGTTGGDVASSSRPGGISIILLNSPRLNISNRNAKECTVFLNNVPTYELAKAVPYLEVNFEVPLPAIESGTDRLLAPTLYKFILGGAVAPEGSTLKTLAAANQYELTGTIRPPSAEQIRYTRTGMELFTVPQTLLNRKNDSTTRVNDILDPTRPLLTLKSFSTSEVQSYAANGYRTAEMQFTLHDRSRMPDIASFIRADLRGNTRVDVEYGWIHPDGEKIVREGSERNAYADLINGMRRREKYQIINNSFSMQENGSVEINLQLATLGYSQMASDLIVSSEPDVVQQINRINNLMEALNNAIDRTGLREEAGRRSTRINGINILASASDAFAAGFQMPPARQLNSLINALDPRNRAGEAVQSTATSAQMREVAAQLRRIWERDPEPPDGTANDSAVNNLRNSLQTSVTNTINDIIQYTYGRSATPSRSQRRTIAWHEGDEDGTNPFDPLVIKTVPQPTGGRNQSFPGIGVALERRRGNSVPSYLQGQSNFQNFSASLATVMMHFVGKPLMREGYHEVQFIYYPFNENAAHASKLNIANFEINLGMLTERLINYRLNNMSRSGTMSLNEFWTFITNNIIDVPSASSYGLSNLYRVANTRERREINDQDPYTTVPNNNQVATNYLISEALRDVTPTGEFHPPQLRLITEALPKAEIATNDDQISDNVPKQDTILRIHIFDQQATSFAGLGDLLRSERNRILSLDPRDTPAEPDATPVQGLNNQQRNQIYLRALNAGIIENSTPPIPELPGSPPPPPPRASARIRGGFKEIKKFIMNNSPYLLLGTENSLIKKAGFSTLNDPAQNTLNLVNQPRTSEVIAANGEEPGNLPLQVIPIEASLTTMGCPLLTFFSQYFIDFSTGTTADDLYAITGINSNMTPGSYRTTIKLRPVSGYTRYRNFLNELKQTTVVLDLHATAVARAPRAARPAAGGTEPVAVDGQGAPPPAGGGGGGGS